MRFMFLGSITCAVVATVSYQHGDMLIAVLSGVGCIALGLAWILIPSSSPRRQR